MSDPAYPGQWRVSGHYMEQIAKMTHWEYPEAVARFGRQLDAIGISTELENRGAIDGDLIMIGEYDFEFNSCFTNQYIPQYLLDKDLGYQEEAERSTQNANDAGEALHWRPYQQGGFLDEDSDELVGFMSSDWDIFSEGDNYDALESNDDFEVSDEQTWTPS